MNQHERLLCYWDSVYRRGRSHGLHSKGVLDGIYQNWVLFPHGLWYPQRDVGRYSMECSRELRMGRRKYNRYSQRIERNILSVYIRANEFDREDGLHWYANAHETAVVFSHKYGVSLPTAVGVIAALSPGRNWGMNLLEAEDFIKAYTRGHRGKDLPIVGTYGYRNIKKSIAILNGKAPLDVLGGNKVRSFYANILDPKGLDVTIDRHAKGLAIRSNSARGATNELDAIVTNAEYPYYAKHYIKLAERLGLIPNQLQAICWVTWRRLKGELNQTDLPF